MAQVLHKRATTTHVIRAEIQRSQDSIAALSKRYNLNPKTVRKWRNRETIEDAPMGPTTPHSTSMTPLQEAAAVAFRQKTLLPLDDCLHALRRTIPTLTRSSLHRLYKRHGISQLPREPEREKRLLRIIRWAICTSASPKPGRLKGLFVRRHRPHHQVRPCRTV